MVVEERVYGLSRNLIGRSRRWSRERATRPLLLNGFGEDCFTDPRFTERNTFVSCCEGRREISLTIPRGASLIISPSHGLFAWNE